MTNEKLYEILGDINEKYVKEAREYRKTKKPVWLKWGAMAACLCLIVSIIPILQHSFLSSPTISLEVNLIEDISHAYNDLDGTSYNGLSEEELSSVKKEFASLLGIEYDEFIECIPGKFELHHFYALFVPAKADGSSPRTLHDYVFTYTTESGGMIEIALCSFDKPLRDVIIVQSGYKSSQINDVTLAIYGTNNYFIVEFKHQNINYYIKANGINIDELQDLLCGIIL